MNWDAIGAMAESLGAIAVIVSILYLATQVRQTNQMAKFDIIRELMGQFNELNRLYATDSTIRRVLLQEGDLSAEQADQLYTYTEMYCNAWAATQIAFDRGQIDKSIFDMMTNDIQFQLIRWPNIRQSIEHWLNNNIDMKTVEIFKAFDRL